VARNLNSVTIPTIDEASRFPKKTGQLRIAFLSRIAPKKNLDGVLAMLSDETLRGEIDLAIYGPVDDSEHWDRCQEIIRTLPPNIRVHYEGAVENDQVSGTLARHHLFFFPTLGESFGYVILESLLAGCPVLLSDTTPWANLEPAKAGWALPLEDLDSFVDIVQKCIDMDADDHAEWSTGARGFAHAHIENSEPKDEMRRLLLTAAQGSS
jgi:glycosyltransferase involved in cell wall biosynthesis